MKYILGISIVFFLSYAAADDRKPSVTVFVKSLANLAFDVMMKTTKVIPPQKAFCVDMHWAFLLREGVRKSTDIPKDFVCLMPWTSMLIARQLTNAALTSYYDRNTVVQTYFGPRLREGEGFVKDRKALFEAFQNQPQIARAIKQKQQEATS